MIYVFEDGRILYDETFVAPGDHEKAVVVETLSPVPPIEGQVGYWVANLETGQLEARYMDYVEPEFDFFPKA